MVKVFEKYKNLTHQDQLNIVSFKIRTFNHELALKVSLVIAASIMLFSLLTRQWEFMNVGVLSLFIGPLLIRLAVLGINRQQSILFLINAMLGAAFLGYLVFFLFNFDMDAWTNVYGFRNIYGHVAGHFMLAFAVWVIYPGQPRKQVLVAVGFMLAYELLEALTLNTYFYPELGGKAWSMEDTIIDLISNFVGFVLFYFTTLAVRRVVGQARSLEYVSKRE